MDSLLLQEELTMHRFYADPERSDACKFYLTSDDAHHAVSVLRLHPGDNAEVFFRGDRWICELDSCGRGVVFTPLKKLASTDEYTIINKTGINI